MPRTGLVRLFAASVLAVGLGLAAMIGTATADDVEGADETHTTLLQPGLNAAGWTEPEADVAAIFEALPRLERVYGWDPDAQWFRWAARDASGPLGDLERLTPGMGLWLDIGGIGPAVWTRPLVAPSGLARLRPGWNFVVWAGPDGATVADALSELERDGILVGSAGARRYDPQVVPAPDAATPRTLARGSPFWLQVSDAKQWWQLADAPRVEFVGEVPPSRQRELRDMVDDAVAWFINRFGLAVPGLTVRFGDAEADMVCGGYAHKVIYLKPDCFSAIAHEYSHALQEHLATTAHKSPAWLVEGVANRWSAQWHDARGDRTYDNHRRVTVIPQAQQTAVSLRSMESREGLLLEEELGHATYSLAHLAADHLAELAGDDALFTYWAQRPLWSSWESAFGDTFGMGVEEFYSSFEGDRQMIAPSYRCNLENCFRIYGTVRGYNGIPIEGAVVEITEIPTGEVVYNSETSERGVFTYGLPQGNYTIKSIVSSLCYGDQIDEINIEIPIDSDSDQRNIDLYIPTIEPCPPIEGIVIGPDLRPLSGLVILAYHSQNYGPYSSLSNATGMFRIIPPAQPLGHYYRLQFRAGRCPLGWYDSDTGRMIDDLPAARVGVYGGVTTSIVVHVRSTSCDLSEHSGAVGLFVPDYRPAP